MHKFKSWKNKHTTSPKSRYTELSFQTCLWYRLIFSWIAYGDSELCVLETLNNSDGKLHKNLHNNTGYMAWLSGVITHRNTKPRTMLEYIVHMSMCFFWGDVFFSRNLPHKYLHLWQVNSSWFIIFGTRSQNHWSPRGVQSFLLALQTWCKAKRRFWIFTHFPLLSLNHKRTWLGANRMFREKRINTTCTS